MEPRVKAKMDLVGMDGNAFSIIGNVSRELRRAGATQEEITAFQTEASAGDYDNVLVTAMKWTEPLTEDNGDEDEYDFWGEDEDE